MAKELPYFKFSANEWLTGDIAFEDLELQGLFIMVCSTYWSKDCTITLTKLKQRLSNAKPMLWDKLTKGNYITVNDDNVSVSFLDEQLQELKEAHAKRVNAGRKGGLSNAKAKPKQVDIDEDIEVDKDKEKSKIPTLQEVIDYFIKNGYKKEAAEKAFKFYNDAMLDRKGRVWKDSRGNTIKSWKQKMVGVWFKDENKDVAKFTPKPIG